MKMKEVCEKTGLTDRTVRYYIDADLIHPDYTENYLGRKTFRFSDVDVAQLKDIATLRAFEFSIDQIHTLLLFPESSPRIIKEVREQTESALVENEKKLGALSSLDVGRSYTVSELAHELSRPVETPGANETVLVNPRKKILEILRMAAVFLIVWSPIVLVAVMLGIRITATQNPLVNPLAAVLSAASLFPSVLTVILTRRSGHKGMLGKRILLGLCGFCIPLSVIFSLGIVSECQHTWGDFVTETAATCTNDGRLLRVCEACGSTDSATVARLSHTPVTDPAREATCLEEGLTEGSHCASCQMTLTKQTPIKRLEHTPVIIPAVAPTCTAGGLTEGVECSTCNTLLAKQQTLKPTDHSYHLVSEVQATCGADGYLLYQCDCGKKMEKKTRSADEKHNFIPNADHGDYYCTRCYLVVCEYGYLDGIGNNQTARYYITGPADAENIDRTLVIRDSGGFMPNFSPFDPPPWVGRYILEVKHIVLKEGVATMGNYAFYWGGGFNYYQYVTSFVIENPHLVIPDERDVSGITCPIQYKKP